jgi:hypothetical protein
MLLRNVAMLVGALTVSGLLLADEFRGNVTKVENGSITVKSGFGGFGKGKKTEAEEKTFKIGKDVKITRAAGKDKEEVKLTLDELKTAVKVTNVFVTVTHEGDNVSAITVGGGFGGIGKKKKDDKKDGQ